MVGINIEPYANVTGKESTMVAVAKKEANKDNDTQVSVSHFCYICTYIHPPHNS